VPPDGFELKAMGILLEERFEFEIIDARLVLNNGLRPGLDREIR